MNILAKQYLCTGKSLYGYGCGLHILTLTTLPDTNTIVTRSSNYFGYFLMLDRKIKKKKKRSTLIYLEWDIVFKQAYNLYEDINISNYYK